MAARVVQILPAVHSSACFQRNVFGLPITGAARAVSKRSTTVPIAASLSSLGRERLWLCSRAFKCALILRCLMRSYAACSPVSQLRAASSSTRSHAILHCHWTADSASTSVALALFPGVRRLLSRRRGGRQKFSTATIGWSCLSSRLVEPVSHRISCGSCRCCRVRTTVRSEAPFCTSYYIRFREHIRTRPTLPLVMRYSCVWWADLLDICVFHVIVLIRLG